MIVKHKNKKTMKNFTKLLFVLLAAISCTLNAVAAYDGTPVTPTKINGNYADYGLSADYDGYYVISTAEELYGFAELVNGGTTDANGVLTANIVVNSSVLTDDGELNGDGSDFTTWTPIGTEYKVYIGTFDGFRHTISGLYFNYGKGNNSNSYVGLFGCCNGSIKNVGVVDSYIYGSQNVGGICGSFSGANISQCYNVGTIISNGTLGIGYAGGISGLNGENVTITTCYNIGKIGGIHHVGGISGYIQNNGIIKDCYNIGTVNGTDNDSYYVGAIVGEKYSNGKIQNCYYRKSCAIDGRGKEQGERGYGSPNDRFSDNYGLSSQQVAYGEMAYLLNGSTDEGDLVWYQTIGTDESPVLNNTHNVVYASSPCPYSNNSNREAEHRFDDPVSGLCSVCGGGHMPCTLVTNDNYESLNLTAEYIGYYAIGNMGQLYSFAEEVNSGNNTINGVLVSDITVNENMLNDDGSLNGTPEYKWIPIGNETTNYTGVFDGQGYSISGLCNKATVIPDDKYVGLFGYASGAEIKNVGIVASFRAQKYVGGICGYVASGCTIANCYNIGGTCYTYNGSYVGGICGYLASGSTIANCWNTATIGTTHQCSGAIVGYSYGTVTNCCYLQGCATDGSGKVNGVGSYGTVDDVAGVTTPFKKEDIAGGKLTYLLNGSTSEGDLVWYQNLETDIDNMPVLDKTHGVVYMSHPCPSYSNSEIGENPHSLDEMGHCSVCGEYTIVPPQINGVYQIANVAHLYWFSYWVNEGNATTKGVLTADIVVNENVLTEDGELNGDGSDFIEWIPIGKPSSPYQGTFDGNNHTISGLYYNNLEDSYVGLFGYCNNAAVKNLGIVDTYFQGNNYVGGICGDGVYGHTSSITACYNAGTIKGDSYVGGLGGSGYCGISLTNCYNVGKVTGTSSRVGGICGYPDYVKDCYNVGTVIGGSNFVGSICGRVTATSKVTNCYYLAGSATNGSEIEYFGIGGNYSSAEDVTGVTTAISTDDFAQGKITYLLNGGATTGNIVWYQNVETNKDACPVLDNSHKIVYVSSPCQSKYSNTEGELLEHVFDNSGICTVCGAHQPPTIVDEENYLSLGLTADYIGWYAIENIVQLCSFAEFVNDGSTSINGVLIDDIVDNENLLDNEFSLNYTPEQSWTPIVSFSGTFDGRGHTISGLYFEDPNTSVNYPSGGNNIGLFSSLAGGTVKNVGVTDTYFYGCSRIGGIAGSADAYSTIANCSFSGLVVSQYSRLGGICGECLGSITNCYNVGTVSGSGQNYVGGICGSAHSGTTTSNSRITNCYNMGTVYGTSSYDGAICGDSNGSVSNCYYLEGSSSSQNNHYGTPYSNEEFKSGRIAYLLNDGTSEGELAWYQTLGDDNDSAPVLDSAHKIVYGSQPCVSEFSNAVIESAVPHDLDEIGHCSRCGEYTPAVLVTAENYEELNLTADYIGFYAIGSAGQLYWFASKNSSTNDSFNGVLVSDIQINADVLAADGSLNGDGSNFHEWTPIGDGAYPYIGVFDGQNHIVSGLYYNNPLGSGAGLFGVIGRESERTKTSCIKNVGVVDSYISGMGGLGGICGTCCHCEITHCYNSSTIEGHGSGIYIGGIFGYATGLLTLHDCYNTGQISGNDDYVGGICGCIGTGTYGGSYPSVFTNCYNTGNVSSPKSGLIGGICGVNWTTLSIENCYYLEGTISNNDQGIPATEFESGKIAYLLNNNGESTLWKQNLYSDALPSFDAGKNPATGYIVESGDTYTVVGDMFLATDYEIAEGKTLNVPYGTSLTITDEAVVTNNGTLCANGTLSGNNLAGNGTFVTERLDLCGISNLNESYVYKGSAYTLEDGLSEVAINTELLGKTFTLDVSYNVSYSENRNVGTATITWANNDNAEDVISKNFEITVRPLNLNNLTADDKEYDGNAIATLQYTTDEVDGDAITISYIATFVDKSADKEKVVTYNFEKSGDDAANYEFAPSAAGEKTADITPKAIEISNIVASSKEYDGNAVAEVTYSYAGVIENDDVEISYTASFADKTVGTDKTVTFNFEKLGADADNYVFEIESSEPKANITAKTLTLSDFVASDKVYDGTTVATNGAFADNRVAGDELEFTFDYEFETENADENISVIFSNIAVSGADAENYELATLEGMAKATISPITDEVVVTVELANKSIDYDGEQHEYSAGEAWTITSSHPLYNAQQYIAELEMGAEKVQGTDAGEYAFGWSSESFENDNANFTTVRFDVTDGALVINKIDGVQVTIAGVRDTAMYDGLAHTVEGFAFSASNALYKETDMVNNGLAATASQTEAGETKMGLMAANFANVNSNFSNVTFSVEDGGIVVEPKNDVVVTITENSGTVAYNGEEQTVSGYAFTSNSELYKETDFTFNGVAEVKGTVAGTYEMNISVEDFENANANFVDVTFNVVDGKLTIEKSEETPNMPELTIETHMLKLTYVELPEGWAWEDETLGLVEGENEVIANYVGADAGNYTTEKVTITITRLACLHDGEHVILGAKEPTCTVDGYTGDLSCSICGLVYEQGTVIPALGHTHSEPVEENRKEPTCTVAGSVDTVVYCTIDHEELSRETYVLPATGHIAGEPVAENYVAPTKTETGSVDSVVYCTIDGEELSRESYVLPMLPDEGTAISDVAGNETVIYAYGHTIVVETASFIGSDIMVYDINGRIIAKVSASDERTEINVPRTGVYGVRIETVSATVIVR